MLGLPLSWSLGLPIVVAPGTTKGWVNPSPAQPLRQLVIRGGFAVDDGCTRQLERRAQRLGFADLSGYLQARSDAGHSIPQLATETRNHPVDRQAAPDPGRGQAAATC
jgi:hypothetical protein